MNITAGEKLVYYPPPINQDDRRHFPALVEAVTPRRVRVRIFMEGAPDGVVRSVSSKRLRRQADMFEDAA